MYILFRRIFDSNFIINLNDLYKKYANLEKGDIIKVYGKIEKRNGSYQIIIENLVIQILYNNIR